MKRMLPETWMLIETRMPAEARTRTKMLPIGMLPMMRTAPMPLQQSAAARRAQAVRLALRQASRTRRETARTVRVIAA
jgi:hypothetical protein